MVVMHRASINTHNSGHWLHNYIGTITAERAEKIRNHNDLIRRLDGWDILTHNQKEVGL